MHMAFRNKAGVAGIIYLVYLRHFRFSYAISIDMVITNTSKNERSAFLPSISVCSFGGVLLSHMSASDIVLALAEFHVTPSDSIRAQRAQLLEELLGSQPAAPIVDSVMVFEGQLASGRDLSSEEQEMLLIRQRELEESLAKVSGLLDRR
jgi:hypothetical protein